MNLLHPATRTERTDAETERRTATNAIRRIVDAREIAQVVTSLASTKAANVSHRRGHRCQRRLDPRDVSVRRAIVFSKEMRAVAAEGTAALTRDHHSALLPPGPRRPMTFACNAFSGSARIGSGIQTSRL